MRQHCKLIGLLVFLGAVGAVVATSQQAVYADTSECLNLNVSSLYYDAKTEVSMSGGLFDVSTEFIPDPETGYYSFDRYTQIGRLINTRRKSDGTGAYEYTNVPSATAKATFVHKFKPTEALWCPASTQKFYYFIQEKVDDGEWVNTTSSPYVKTWTYSAEAMGELNLLSTVERTRTFNSKERSSVSSPSASTLYRGEYITVCQRLYYSSSVPYEAAYSGDWNKATFREGEQVCASFRNPRWEEKESGETRDANIKVTSKVRWNYASSGCQLDSNPIYCDAVSAFDDLYFGVEFDRYDSGYDGGGLIYNTFPSADYFSTSSNYDVGVGSPTTGTGIRYKLLTTYPTASSPITEVIPDNPVVPTLKNSWEYYEDSDYDDRSALRVKITPDADSATKPLSSYACSNEDCTSYIPINKAIPLLAGETKELCIRAQHAQSEWTATFVDYLRRPTYNSGGPVEEFKYDRTTLIDTRPRTVMDGASPKAYTSAPYCATFHRDYNWRIADIGISQAISDDTAPAISNQTFQATFRVNVERKDNTKNYITDIDNAKVYSLSYVLPKGTSQDQAIVFTSPQTVDTLEEHCSELPSGSCNVLEKDLSTLTGESAHFSNGVYDKTNTCEDSEDSYCYAFNIQSDSFDAGDLQVGDKFCIQLAITPQEQEGEGIRLSPASCVNIGKRPYFSVLGGSVQSLSTIKGSFTQVNQDGTRKYYGASAEFAAVANGSITRFASGQSFAGGHSSSSSIFCEVSPLTFANSQCDVDNKSAVSELGKLNISSNNILAQRFITRYHGGANEIKTSDIKADTFNEYGGNTAIYSDTPIVIYSNSDIYIRSDIMVDSSRSYDSTTVPQVYIIAEQSSDSPTPPNIYIDSSVHQIDAILITSGSGGASTGIVDTCAWTTQDGVTKRVITPGKESAHDDPDLTVYLSSDICNEPLTINGSIIAGSILLKRTHGADNSSNIDQPAETINLRPSVYLSGADVAGRTNQPTTTYLRELAPRQ